MSLWSCSDIDFFGVIIILFFIYVDFVFLMIDYSNKLWLGSLELVFFVRGVIILWFYVFLVNVVIFGGFFFVLKKVRGIMYEICFY